MAEIKVPAWAQPTAIALVRAAVIATFVMAWTLWRDVDTLKRWREQIHPLEEEAGATQLQTQITEEEMRGKELRARVEMLEADVLMLQLQVARFAR